MNISVDEKDPVFPITDLLITAGPRTDRSEKVEESQENSSGDQHLERNKRWDALLDGTDPMGWKGKEGSRRNWEGMVQ